MATAISWLVGTVIMFLGFGVLGCSAFGRRRRARFYTRLGCGSLVLVALALGLGIAIRLGILPGRVLGGAWLVLLLVTLAMPPVFCYRAVPSGGTSDDDDGDGGPGPGQSPPDPPRGGAPLPDADQSRTRRRDHNRSRLRDVTRRRPAVEPGRRQSPSRPGRR
ncbi:MAG TPA: hypothetical protein VME01_09775 [Solirubrobacteraceae bacterium]|nr:hypothetical protein [Solirubrobacteraceae bacterium]